LFERFAEEELITTQRIPAMKRSIEEIKIEGELS